MLHRAARAPTEAARADARLGVAVVRGLLLDLLATGDRSAVDAALKRDISQHETVARQTTAAGRVGTRRREARAGPPAGRMTR